MSSFFRSFAFTVGASLLVSRLAAQTAPAQAPAHSHTPAASPHAGPAVTLDQFVTSASPLPRNQVDLAQATTVLGGTALLLKQQSSLGETLSAETGMSATSFGPGASRPIIRGLGGDRIRLLENSVGTLDASVASPDHAVSVEPFLVERIEILRGPASLLYGSNAVGGVVNVITHRIETDLPAEPVRGGAEVRYGSGAREFSRGGVLDLALQPQPDRAVVFHADGFQRSSDDVRIPGFAESARIRDAETAEARAHDEPGPDFARGRLPNSAVDTRSAAAGVSYVTPQFHVGASYSGYNSWYGVPGHAHDDEGGVRIDLRQRRTDIQAEWHGSGGFLRGARLKFGQARYRHAEIEPEGTVGTLFRNRGYDARLELLHGDGHPWSGATGVQSSSARFAALGDEAFLPPSRSRSDAVFTFQEIEQGPLTWQLGARWERTRITPEGGGPRRDDNASGSVGAVWKPGRDYAVAVSLTHTGRAPNAQELFADGPHAGTQSYEIGDRALRAERSTGAELSLRRRTGRVTGAVTVYTHRFDGYIFGQPTGEVAQAVNQRWIVGPAAEASSATESLPVYRQVQRDALFWGAEVETLWHVHEQRDWQLDLRLAADATRAHEGSRPLPRIPAHRLSGGLAWTHGPWTAGTDGQWVLRQNRVADHETPTPGYTLLSAHVSRSFTTGHLEWQVFARGTNLTDVEARPHPSFVKDLAPLPGRALSAGVRLAF